MQEILVKSCYRFWTLTGNYWTIPAELFFNRPCYTQAVNYAGKITLPGI